MSLALLSVGASNFNLLLDARRSVCLAGLIRPALDARRSVGEAGLIRPALLRLQLVHDVLDLPVRLVEAAVGPNDEIGSRRLLIGRPLRRDAALRLLRR